jgi:hypothetical protein
MNFWTYAPFQREKGAYVSWKNVVGLNYFLQYSLQVSLERLVTEINNFSWFRSRYKSVLANSNQN